MCFSATASFSAGAVLLGVGTLTLRSSLASHQRRDFPFAAIPLLFAIQQLIEGVIWLTFHVDAPLLNSVMTYVYSFFSHALWPVYVPVAVMLMEPNGWRRRTLIAFVAAGAAVGAYLLFVLVAYPIVSAYRSAHRIRFTALLCGCDDDAVLAVDRDQPAAVHTPHGCCLRRIGAAVVWRGLRFLCDVVHLGLVLLRSAAERGGVSPFSSARARKQSIHRQQFVCASFTGGMNAALSVRERRLCPGSKASGLCAC